MAHLVKPFETKKCKIIHVSSWNELFCISIIIIAGISIEESVKMLKHTDKDMGSVCPSVCLSVCLSVGNAVSVLSYT